MMKQLWQALVRKYAVRGPVQVGENVWIGLLSRLWAPTHLSIGANCYIGKLCTIEVDGSIGRDCLIGNNAGLVGRWDHLHRTVGRSVRTAPWIGDRDGYPAKLREKSKIVVGDDVWIGYGAILLSGIQVGRGALIAAGSVVFDDVSAYAIVSGNPAVQVGLRFDLSQIAEHEDILNRLWRQVDE